MILSIGVHRFSSVDGVWYPAMLR